MVKKILDYLLKSQKSENIDFIIDLLKNLKKKNIPGLMNLEMLINRNLASYEVINIYNL